MGTVYATSQFKDTSVKNFMGVNSNEIPFGKGHLCDHGDLKEDQTKTVNLQGISARVDRVNVDGVIRTKPELISHSVRELFTADNFEDMIRKAHSVRGKLQSLGIFRNVAIHIDTSTGAKSSPNGYEVTYEVVEINRIFGGVTTQMTNHGEIALVVNGVMPNLLGKAETFKVEYTYGSNRTNTLGCSLIKPLLLDRNPILTLSGFKHDSEWPMSGYKVIDKAFQIDLSWFSYNYLKQSLQYEADWRQFGAGNRYASFDVREDSGHSLKSAIKHIATIDFRDSKIFPTCGSFYNMINEFSGLGGNVAFLKNEASLQWNFPFPRKEFVFQFAFNLGHMMDVGDGGAAVCDNFFLGGPMSLRGFEFRGTGPSSSENFTGAKMYWCSGLHLYTPLPFKPGTGGFGDLFRTHLWVNAGNIGNWNLVDFDSFREEQRNNTRLTYGFGVAFRLGQMARVEVNYCFPYLCPDTDKKVEGVQLGIGVHFL